MVKVKDKCTNGIYPNYPYSSSKKKREDYSKFYGLKNLTDDEVIRIETMKDCTAYKYTREIIIKQINITRKAEKEAAEKKKLRDSLPPLIIGGYQFWPDNEDFFVDCQLPTKEDYAKWDLMHKKYPKACQYFGMLVKGRNKLRLTFTKQDVADHFGVSLQTVVKAISKLKKEAGIKE